MQPTMVLTAVFIMLTAPANAANTATNQHFSLDRTECPPGHLAYLQTLEHDGYTFTSKGSYDRALALYHER